MKQSTTTIKEYLGYAGLASCASGFFGFLALINIIHNQPLWSIIMVVFATFIDCLDGFIARKTMSDSDFGRQLDGMFDFINYSIFSGTFIYQFVLPNIYGILIGAMIILFGAIRLVRFNIEGFFKKDEVWCYPGLGTTLVMVPLILGYLLSLFCQSFIWLTVAGSTIIGILQISRIPLKKDTNLYLVGIPCLLIALSLAIYFLTIG